MLASCMGFAAQKKKCSTPILQGIAYFLQPYLGKEIRLQDISNTCEVTAFYSSKKVNGILWCISRKSSSMEEKISSKVRKIPLLSNKTKHRWLHISEDLLKQLLDKLKKAQLFGIYLDGTTDNSEEVQLVVCYRFANQETKTTVELCCLNVGGCSTAQAIFAKLNQFVEKHRFDWMKYKAVATKEAVAVQCTTNGVARKIKNISLEIGRASCRERV